MSWDLMAGAVQTYVAVCVCVCNWYIDSMMCLIDCFTIGYINHRQQLTGVLVVHADETATPCRQANIGRHM